MKTSKRNLLLGSILCVILASGLIVSQAYMYYVAQEQIGQAQEDNLVPGQVGLRQYFDSGKGTELEPYIITRPIHYYNLSRLQSLGAFSNKKYHFQLGKRMTVDQVTGMYVYDNDGNPSKVLNMNNFPRDILSIGSSVTPFYSEFEGNDLIIDNLTVKANADDIGTFGYLASGSIVKNTYFTNLTVQDIGYNTSTSALYENMQGRDILTCEAEEVTTIPMNKSITLPNGGSELLGYTFTLNTSNLPSTSDGYDVTYSIRSASEALFKIENNTARVIDTQLTAAFNGQLGTISTKFYITGSIVKDGIVYGKVVSSYTIKFVHSEEGNSVNMIVVKDPYLGYENYTHNSNIGLIVGHCDGAVKDCYIYNGSLSLNNTSHKSPMLETQYGFIGEAGINLADNIGSSGDSPTGEGDTGILNFTNVYTNINPTASEATVDNPNPTSRTTTQTYNYWRINTAPGNLFEEYLRRYDISGGYQNITNLLDNSSPHSIDFTGKQVIKENDNKSRGLGVFQVNTGNYDVSNNFLEGLGDFYINYDSSNIFDDIYYTTAELDATLGGTVSPSTFYNGHTINDWNLTESAVWKINQGTTLPNPTSISAFKGNNSISMLMSKLFERSVNYNIRVPLNNQLTTNYFSKTNNNFLKEYFDYKLRDKDGLRVPYTSDDFGIMIKERVYGTRDIINSSALNSYIKIPKLQYENSHVPYFQIIQGDVTTTYPDRTIEFSIKNIHGANVTIIAGTPEADNNILGIYDKSLFTTDKNNYNNDFILHPSYAMLIPTKSLDDSTSAEMPYYFNYDNNTKNITSTVPSLKNPGSSSTTINRLYAHTFFLPQGEYFIGSPTKECNVYYVCAQGQEEGEIGGNTPIYTNNDAIENMDFLLYDPKQVGFVLNNSRAYASINASFNSTAGTITMFVNTNESNEFMVTYDSSCSSLTINNYEQNKVYYGTSGNNNNSTEEEIIVSI